MEIKVTVALTVKRKEENTKNNFHFYFLLSSFLLPLAYIIREPVI